MNDTPVATAPNIEATEQHVEVERAMLDAFFANVPGQFTTETANGVVCVAASIPLCENDRKWLAGIRAAIAAMDRGKADDLLVEKVARAMVSAQFNDWDQLDGGDHGYWCEMAKAAIEAVQS